MTNINSSQGRVRIPHMQLQKPLQAWKQYDRKLEDVRLLQAGVPMPGWFLRVQQNMRHQ